MEIRPVRYAQAFVAGSERTRTFPGIARAASEQDIAFRVAGTVTAVEVAVGSMVRRGQVLARLDSGDLELRRQQAEAGLAQARAQARNAEASYERVVALFESGNASMSDLDAARASYESANASQTSAATALRLAEQQVSYARLAAPVDGSVSRVMVDVNEAVGAGQTVVVIIATVGSPEVQVTVPETFIGGLQAGRPAQVVFDALADGSFAASVSEVGSAAAGAAGFQVIVRLDGSLDATRVRPGMAAEVTFSIGGRSGTTGVLVPPEAVGQDHTGRFVYVINRSDGGEIATAERRTVETGTLTPEGLEILAGVADGEYVATAGLRTLASGQSVRLLGTR
ncbi:efflux RND transporter periplasmic adaptor subunit [Candidatus Palauibacter sp.]|uniref:efflux RND transporter periplasmic adaptor subunit n=1 Tax=Candidatus Palauibacter sp. TaxID=3101350 RepID=UPI003B51C15F